MSSPAAVPSLSPTPADVWTGRDDGPGAEHARWHSVVRATDPASADPGDVALIGFASDEGVRRNHGRVGAAAAPDAIRRALASTALGALPASPAAGFTLHDAGTIAVVDGDLAPAQAALGEDVAGLLGTHRLVVVLGGGHETAYGSYQGRRFAARTRTARTAVINLDAHFDLRAADEPTSGTPFRQMALSDAAGGQPFDYTVIGIAPGSNTRVLFDTAAELGATVVLDRDSQPRHLDAVLATVDAALADAEVAHLSIDIDVLPASVAPGVSAPAAYGVPLEVLVAVTERVAASGKLAVLDIVEVNPTYDIDSRTVKAAARLVSAAVEALPAS